MKRILRRATWSLALVVAGTAFAQAPKPLANPNFRLVDGSTVYASARHPDGGAVLIGNFSSINGEVHSGIARLRPDGSVDSSWGRVRYQHYPQGFNRPVVAVDGSGAAYAAGIVNSTSGSYLGLVKLSASTGEVVTDWRSSAGSFPFLSLVADATGVYVGKLDGFRKVSTETGATLWSAPYAATSLTLDHQGAIYAVVLDHGDPPRPTVARFSADTGVRDTSWNPAVTPTLSGWLQPLTIDACGSVYVAGNSAVGDGAPRNRVVKISASDGQVDPNWDPGDVVGVDAIAADAQCSVYLGGRFETIAGQPRKNLAKLSRLDGHLVDDWVPEGVCCGVRELATGLQGRITVAGSFKRVGTQTRLGFAALDVATGEAGSAIDAEAPAQVTAIAADPSGGVVVGGFFAKAGSLPRHGLLRLRANGTLDPDWAPALEGYVQVAVVSARPDGKVYVGGSFDRANLQTRRNIAKFVGRTGELDPVWNPDADGFVEAMAFGADDDSVYVGGVFTAVGGQARASIAKLSGVTGLAYPNWNPQPDGEVCALAVDASGVIYAGGAFREVGGQTHWRLAKIAPESGNVLHDWTGTTDSPLMTLIATGTALYVAPTAWPIQKLSIDTGAADPVWNSSGPAGSLGFAATTADSVYATMWYSTGERQLKRYSADTGAEDPTWNISPSGGLVGPLAIDTRETVYVGSFTPSGLAAYSVDTVFFDPFDP
ncbi:hypothetical protein [Dokdonella ginsengisoli]|uniref:PQQ-binding-like beta-propeller repeat protein n=1 Tax=Dokdonella ginsengisoli TaxID=363846 RepID=A0ABV9QTQ1_9GAMM